MPKKQIIISVPEVASITVTGPTQCGKSIVVDRIKKMLEAEFGAAVVSKDWQAECSASTYENLDQWQAKMVRDTIWYISEPNREQDND